MVKKTRNIGVRVLLNCTTVSSCTLQHMIDVLLSRLYDQ